ncbi:MAG: hypothetical protein P8Y67_13470, partial [Alphaproteobacteria bacterium]
MPASSPLNEAKGGPELSAHGNRVRLTNPGAVYRAVGGGVDVFALHLSDEAEAARLPLFRVEEGGFLFGLGQVNDVCLLAVPVAGARAEAMAANTDIPLTASVDAWISKLLQMLAATPPQQVQNNAVLGLWTLEPEHAIRPAQTLAWVWTVEGEASICGAMPVPGAGATPLPVSPSCFITATSTAPATLQAVSTESLLTSGATGDPLTRTFTAFGEAFLPRIAEKISNARTADKTLLSARQAASHTLWQRARLRLTHAIEEDAAPIAPASRWDDDPVFQAVAVLAGEVGARENAPSGENAIPAEIRDRLEAIGRA